MKAMILTEYGGVDRFELRSVPDPVAGKGALLVRMAGASINPIDWKQRSGAYKAYFPLEFPAILGRDASGEVVKVGEGVTSFKAGDRVFGFVNGAYAELVTAPLEHWAKVPPGLDLAEAGALPLVVLTGAQLMERAVDPPAGAAVLVTGAIGGVGRVAVHAAKLRRAKVWAGVRASQRDEAKKLGADGIVALDEPADIEKLPTLDAIADTVGGDIVTKLYGKLKSGGAIGSVVGEPSGAKDRGFAVHAFQSRPDSAMLAKYAAEIAEKKLVIPIAAKLPLAEVGKAHTLAEKHPKGKILLLG
jgi:NADPH:quinone reductase-like Zn-dependent oxidoreductase